MDSKSPHDRREAQINRHFEREAKIQAAVFPALLVFAVLMALVVPWLLRIFR